MVRTFRNRTAAGAQLAERLTYLRGADVVVLGLPRGGVPVAFEVAQALDAPLDVIVVRKVGVPGQPELAMGAIGEDDVRVVNDEVVYLVGISAGQFERAEQRERDELQRRATQFRGTAPRVDLHGRIALIVDDGIATGSTARAACQVARAHGAERVVLAAPVAAPESVHALAGDADEIVCVEQPAWLRSVGRWYDDFTQVDDATVVELLQRARRSDPKVATARDPLPREHAGRACIQRDAEVDVDVDGLTLPGHLAVPEAAIGVVVFAHGSGSSRLSPRNRFVAERLNAAGLATLTFDLLTDAEATDRRNVFDIGLLAARLRRATAWVRRQEDVAHLPVALFGASTGAAAALVAAATNHLSIAAVVSRGGRPDLAGDHLDEVSAPTLLIVGGDDSAVLRLNREAARQLTCEHEVAVVPGATHLFEEPGTLESAANLAAHWFVEHCAAATPKPPAATLPERLRTARLSTLTQLGRSAQPIEGHDDDYSSLIDQVADRRVVLIGEASHGSQEFYRERARITQRLIEDHGFGIVAVEADWPDAYRVNRYVMGLSDDGSAEAALADFRRFPTWMWRNTEVTQFAEWLRRHNEQITDPSKKARFHGLDLYSLRTSMDAVVAYLDNVDPAEAARARERYSCFDHVGAEGQAYGFALAYQQAIPCESEVVAQLISLRRQASNYLRSDGWLAEDELFCAEQNAVAVRDAEEYYQQMYRAEASSWNLRDRHMAATLDALLDHFDRRGGHTKVVVWEHNSHIGDARATAMAARGELNLGQLARQRYGEHAVALIGLTTYDGEVTAATDWGRPAQRRTVRPALPESYEHLLHEVVVDGLAPDRFWLPTSEPTVSEALAEPRLERAIGVIYRPQTERASHYFPARLDRQFDFVVHLDRTSALQPLDDIAAWDPSEPAETYPSGI